MSDTLHAHDTHGQHGDHGHAHPPLGFIRKYLFSIDHKIIGIQFLFMGLTFFVIGGLLAMLIRLNMGWPDAPVPILGKMMGWSGGVMPGDFYTMVFTMHASIMIFFVIIPLLVGTFGNYLVPLKIGAGDMAFPFLNGLAFWSAVPTGAIMLAGFFMPGNAAAAGWTSYPPLSSINQNTKWLDYVEPQTAFDHFASFMRADAHIIRNGIETHVQGTWPTASLLILFVMFYLMWAFVGTWFIRFPDSKENDTARLVGRAIGGTLAVLGAIAVFVLLFSSASSFVLKWNGEVLLNIPLLVGLFAVAAGLAGIFCGLNQVLVVTLSMILAYGATIGTQYAAFDGQSCWFFSLFLLGFSSLMGAVNYLTTMIKLRCPGMTMFRMPLSVWSLFITSVLVLLATPVLASTLLLNLLEHHIVHIGGETMRFASFFTPYNWIDQSVGIGRGVNAGGGYPLLHQHLFWFYSHPAVYIMILPAMGMVSDILAVFARKPIFGYRPMVYAMAGIAFLGFIVWAHHMFQSGMNPTLGTTFAISTMFIAVPSAIKTFNWLGTLWGGNIKFTAAMWNAIAFVSMFVIGGLSGIFMASTAVDVHIHDTYFIVAHIHYVLFGGTTFGIFGAIYFWYPKMFGRMMNETLGKIHFFLSIIFFNCTFFAMHILGIGGFPRRVAGIVAAGEHPTYTSFVHFTPMNQFISISAFCLGLAQILFAINFLGSWIWGPKAPRNPWLATTLEWETESPPPHGNFHTVPVVHHGPYEYSSPLVEEDWLAQTRYVEGQENFVVKH